jgi:hypothetical protein
MGMFILEPPLLGQSSTAIKLPAALWVCLKADKIEFTVICDLNMTKDASSNSAVPKSENMEEYMTSSYPCPRHYC